MGDLDAAAAARSDESVKSLSVVEADYWAQRRVGQHRPLTEESRASMNVKTSGS